MNLQVNLEPCEASSNNVLSAGAMPARPLSCESSPGGGGGAGGVVGGLCLASEPTPENLKLCNPKPQTLNSSHLQTFCPKKGSYRQLVLCIGLGFCRQGSPVRVVRKMVYKPCKRPLYTTEMNPPFRKPYVSASLWGFRVWV